MRTNPERALLSAGRNCWLVERADRVALLIGAPAYFSALHHSLMAARDSVRIVGWHLDAATELDVNGEGEADRNGSHPSTLAALLQAVAEREHRFRGFVLDWDYSMLYDVDRALRPALRKPWKRHRRIHFCLDGTQAVGAARHEKIVVVDDAVAFAGGIELGRPSSPEAPAAAAVQMLLDGPAAAALSQHLRSRWRRVVGRDPRLPQASARAAPPWPSGVQVDFEAVDVAIARTAAADGHRPAVTEVAQLLRDAIDAAQQRLYLEVPSLSAAAVADALVASLQRAQGPEIVVVAAHDVDAWLDPTAQRARRAAAVRRLRAADAHGRLRLLHPVCAGASGKEDTLLPVAGLTLVADERLLVVGSADGTQRSLVLDTECCLAIEARGQQAERVSAQIGRCRDGLLEAHLGVAHGVVSQALSCGGTLFSIIDRDSGAARRLRPLPDPAPDVCGGGSATVEQPVSIDALSTLFKTGGGAAGSHRGVITVGVVVLLVLAATAAWRWTPLSAMVDVNRLAAMARKVADTPLAPLWVLISFMGGSLIAMPITLLIVATSLVFTTAWALVYALGGSLAAAALNFGVGRLLGDGFVGRIGGERWNRLNQRLSQSGVLAVFTLRILPVAPFLVVNLAAGASKLRFRDFMLGSLLGMAPGVLTITVFSGLVTRLIHHPSPKSIAILVAGGATLLGLAWGLQRWVGGRSAKGG